MKNKNRVTKRAFTLVELLIVIAIIGILFVVLVSKVDFATDKAKASGVQTDFRSFQVALETVSKENAGFASLGWDTGDANGNRKRDSYDEGDTNTNNIMESTETWTGHKVPGENWTGTYTLVNPDDNTDKSAFKLLEDKVNANLDPRLHITITPEENAGVLTGDAKVTMANAAKDPWKNEYHGVYITNAQNDKGDRGAFIIYSNGANGQWGSEHDIAGGIVTVTVPGNNVRGKDDYALAVFYTYIHGYGEIAVATFGFSNNQQFLGGGPHSGSLDIIDPNPNPGPGIEQPDVPENPEVVEAGLYKAGSNYTVQLYTWQELLDKNAIIVNNGAVSMGSAREIPDDLPAMNEYGFFYGVPYEWNGCEFIFYADKSVEMYDLGELLDTFPAGSALYEHRNINVGPYDITIYDDGYSLECDAFNGTFYCTKLICSGDLWLPSDNSINAIDIDGFYEASSLTGIKMFDNIVSIGDYAFACTFIEQISIPSSVTYIGDGAFGGCYYLTSVTMSDNVAFIGDSAFAECYELREIRLSNKITTLSDSLFSSCESLQQVNIPTNVTSIGNFAFSDCYSLVSVTIPNSVASIGNSAFSNCDSFINVTIPDGVTSIGHAAFSECDNLVSVVIGDSVTSIGDDAFRSCYSLESVTIPDSVASIGNYAFQYCSSLKSVVIGNSVASIGERAFDCCGSLVSVIIPDSVISIGDYAFYNCKSLVSVTIPDSVTSIGVDAIHGCESLTSIIVDDNNQYYKSINGNLYSKDGKTLIQYATGKEDALFEIPAGVTTISDNAFYGCVSLTSVVIPEGVTSIGDWAFCGCDGLASVVIPKSVTTIYEKAFASCDSLRDVYYAGSLAQWTNISIERGNEDLTGAIKHYNYVHE